MLLEQYNLTTISMLSLTTTLSKIHCSKSADASESKNVEGCREAGLQVDNDRRAIGIPQVFSSHSYSICNGVSV